MSGRGDHPVLILSVGPHSCLCHRRTFHWGLDESADWHHKYED